MSLDAAIHSVWQACDSSDPDEIRRAALGLLMATRERWRCPSCGVERTGDVCNLCRVKKPRVAHGGRDGQARRDARRAEPTSAGPAVVRDAQ